MARIMRTQEDTRKRLAELPEDVRSVIYSADMDSVIRQIGAKHNLHIDQMGLLEAEAVEVMLGFTKPADFPGYIQRSLEIDQAEAGAIVQDVNNMLFLKIRESLKKVGEMGGVQGPSPAPPTAPPAPTPPAMPPKPAPLPPMQSPAPSTPPAPKPPTPPQTSSVHSADLMLTQKTANTAPMVPEPASPPAGGQPTALAQGPAADTKPPTAGSTQPPKPKGYGVDPYREPVE